jgi:uncharacterized protein
VGSVQPPAKRWIALRASALRATRAVCTIISVKIEFDPAKDAGNTVKHGISLAMAERLEWDHLLARENTREGFGEVRMVGFAPIGRTLYCVVLIENDGVCRIISLRKALPKEVRAYASQI